MVNLKKITESNKYDIYPDLLRMGHVFVTSFGQRHINEGLYGLIDMTIGGDGWYYALCKRDNSRNILERVSFTKVNLEDQYEPNIYLSFDGEYDNYDEEQFPSPACCESDRNGTLFLTDEHRNKVVLIKTDGAVQSSWGKSGDGPGELNAPSGIVYLPDDTLWVVSTRSSRVQQFTRNGKYIRGFGEFGTKPGQLNYPWGVAIDPVDGSVLVADWRNDRVQRFTPDGDLLHIFDSLVPSKPSLNRPSSVAVDTHGDVYVCDRGNDRVVQFNPRGLFIESLTGDAPMTERGADRLMSNPDMLRWRDYIPDLEREKRFWRPVSVKIDDEFRVFVSDAARFRVQVYKKTFRTLETHQIDPVETYTDPKVN